LFRSIVAVLIFAFGFMIGKYKSISPYYFKKDLDLIGIATIFFNVWLAWYISRVIGKRNDIDKKDKEIVLSRLDKIISNYELFITQVHSNSLNYIDVTSFIKRNTSSIERLCKNFSLYHTFDYSNEGKEISAEMKKLLSLMTYTSPNPIPIPNFQEPVTISQNIITYSATRIDEILLKIDTIIDNVIRLQLLINSK